MYSGRQRGYAPPNRGGYASAQGGDFVEYPRLNNNRSRTRQNNNSNSASWSYNPANTFNTSYNTNWPGNNSYNTRTTYSNNAEPASSQYGNYFGASYYNYNDGRVRERSSQFDIRPRSFDRNRGTNKSGYNAQRSKVQSFNERKRERRTTSNDSQQHQSNSVKKRRQGNSGNSVSMKFYPANYTDEEKDTFAFTCESCDHSFPEEPYLIDHNMRHFQCDFKDCPVWGVKAGLKVHRRHAHCPEMLDRLVFSTAPEDNLLWVENRKKNWPTVQRTAERLAAAAAVVEQDSDAFEFGCESCDTCFASQGDLDLHLQTHIPCPWEGCPVTADSILIYIHKRWAHRRDSKILTSNEPEEVSKWIEKRKENWPTEKRTAVRRRRRAGEKGDLKASSSASEAPAKVPAVKKPLDDVEIYLTKNERVKLRELQQQIDLLRRRGLMRTRAAQPKKMKTVAVGTDPCPEAPLPVEAEAPVVTDLMAPATTQETSTEKVKIEECHNSSEEADGRQENAEGAAAPENENAGSQFLSLEWNFDP